jgi:protein SCO1
MGKMIRTVSWLLLILLGGSAFAEQTEATKNELKPLSGALTGGDFTLQSIDGPVSTTAFRGKLILLYFGYTQCPDVCPTSFSLMAQTLNELNEEELSHIVGIFVSVDPKRDSVERLAEYVNYFHSSFIGVTGSPDEISAAAKGYGVQYSFTDASDSAMGYIVNHSAAVYLIDQEGVLRFAFPHETPPQTMLGAIRMLFDGGKKAGS